MCLHPNPIGEIPSETARVARAAFPKGTVVMRLRDEFSTLYHDEDFRALYPSKGQPALTPWRLALVTVFQFLEHLSDRQAADAVRARIDWKYALGLELTDPGFHFSVLAEFRARFVAGQAEHRLLDTMLERFKTRGLVKARGKQRTDSTHVLGAVRDLHLLELVGETLRATLDDLAAVVPDWVRSLAPPVWFEHYGHRVEDSRLPRSREKREALALEIGTDGFRLLDALDAPPPAAHAVAMVQTMRQVWQIHYARDEGQLRWRPVAELPPVADRLQSPYDPEMHYSMKRQLEWSGYKVHITETCDDDAAHLVTHVKTCPAMQPDMTSTADIHKCLAAKELLPSEHFPPMSTRDCWSAAGSITVSRSRGRFEAWQAGRPVPDRAMTCPTLRSTGKASRSPARRARSRCPGAPSRISTAARASWLSSAGRTVGPAPPRPCALRPRQCAAMSISIHARSTRRSTRRGGGCANRPGRSATRSEPGWKARSRRASVPSACVGAATLGWLRPGFSRFASPPR
jgi:transposase